MDYLGLLRGINVGTNNRVKMDDLKAAFEAAGFHDVSTYINSGNVLFAADASLATVRERCQRLIEMDLKLTVTIAVVPAEMFLETMAAAPDWWGDPGSNLAVILPPETPATVLAKLGEQPAGELTSATDQLLFISSESPRLMATRWAALPTKLRPFVTLRNAKTSLKLAELLRERQ